MLLKDFKNIALSISTTTREKRPYEKEGVHYHFVTIGEFEKKAARNEFAEWANVHGNRYGTAKSTIERYFKEGKHILFDIDVQGAMSLRKQYPNQSLLIFIRPPSMEALKERLVGRRGDSEQAIETRLKNAYDELECAKSFDYQITNDDLQTAYRQLRQIVEKECQSPS
jgi:guanylate kinase